MPLRSTSWSWLRAGRGAVGSECGELWFSASAGVRGDMELWSSASAGERGPVVLDIRHHLERGIGGGGQKRIPIFSVISTAPGLAEHGVWCGKFPGADFSHPSLMSEGHEV